MTKCDPDPTQAFFQLTRRPFSAMPRVDRYFPGETIDHARESLLGNLRRGAGPGLIVGSAGTGKTMLLQVLADQLRETHQVVLLGHSSLCTRRALLQWLLFELGLPYRQPAEGELRLALIDYLRSARVPDGGLAVLVDEAHALPSKLLEELRMMSNLAHRGQPRVQVILAGTDKLDDRLASPELDGLQQRLAARCYLTPFGRDETFRYIHHCIRWAGGDSRDVFAHEAVQAVYELTQGVPRRINQLCDYALVLATAAGQRQLTHGLIREAWSDLEHLPAPSHFTAAPAANADHAWIEFGSLEELDDDEEGTEAGNGAVWARADLEIDRQLHEITEQVAAITEKPAGEQQHAPATPPPVTWHVDDPFAEFFAEEEIIVDRYSAMNVPGKRVGQHIVPRPDYPASNEVCGQAGTLDAGSVATDFASHTSHTSPSMAAEQVCREFVAELVESVGHGSSVTVTREPAAAPVAGSAPSSACATESESAGRSRGLFCRLRAHTADGER